MSKHVSRFVCRFSALQRKVGVLDVGIFFLLVLLFVSIQEYLGEQKMWILSPGMIIFLTLTACKQ